MQAQVPELPFRHPQDATSMCTSKQAGKQARAVPTQPGSLLCHFCGVESLAEG